MRKFTQSLLTLALLCVAGVSSAATFNLRLAAWGDGMQADNVEYQEIDSWTALTVELGTSPITTTDNVNLRFVNTKFDKNFLVQKVAIYEDNADTPLHSIDFTKDTPSYYWGGDGWAYDGGAAPFYENGARIFPAGGYYHAFVTDWFNVKEGSTYKAVITYKTAKPKEWSWDKPVNVTKGGAVKIYPAQNATDATAEGGVYTVVTPAKVANPWDTQFWVVANEAIPSGTPIRVTFDYKADKAFKVGPQTFRGPGDYIGNINGQDVEFGADWATKTVEFKSPSDDFQSMGLSLTLDTEENTYYFRNLKMEIATEKSEEPQEDPTPVVVDPAIDDSDPAVVANKAALLSAINKAQNADLTGKTSASKKALAEALAAAQEQLNSKNTTIAKIDAARRALLQAIDELEDRAAPTAEKAVPAGWKSVIKNGNLEGDDMSCFFSKDNSSDPYTSVTVDEEGIDDWHAIVLQTGGSVAGTDWEDQFFIQATEVIPAGKKFHVEFDYRSDVEAGCDTQCHVTPGNYIHWACIGSPTFKPEWQHFTYEGAAPSEVADKNFQTIAFNLSKTRKDVKIVIDNIVFWVEDAATGIENVETVGENKYFDLQGRRVAQPAKGLYIKNGKKMLVK